MLRPDAAQFVQFDEGIALADPRGADARIFRERVLEPEVRQDRANLKVSGQKACSKEHVSFEYVRFACAFREHAISKTGTLRQQITQLATLEPHRVEFTIRLRCV